MGRRGPSTRAARRSRSSSETGPRAGPLSAAARRSRTPRRRSSTRRSRRGRRPTVSSTRAPSSSTRTRSEPVRPEAGALLPQPVRQATARSPTSRRAARRLLAAERLHPRLRRPQPDKVLALRPLPRHSRPPPRPRGRAPRRHLDADHSDDAGHPGGPSQRRARPYTGWDRHGGGSQPDARLSDPDEPPAVRQGRDLRAPARSASAAPSPGRWRAQLTAIAPANPQNAGLAGPAPGLRRRRVSTPTRAPSSSPDHAHGHQPAEHEGDGLQHGVGAAPDHDGPAGCGLEQGEVLRQLRQRARRREGLSSTRRRSRRRTNSTTTRSSWPSSSSSSSAAPARTASSRRPRATSRTRACPTCRTRSCSP